MQLGSASVSPNISSLEGCVCKAFHSNPPETILAFAANILFIAKGSRVVEEDRATESNCCLWYTILLLCKTQLTPPLTPLSILSSHLPCTAIDGMFPPNFKVKGF